MSSPKLVAFLRNLNVDPSLLASFERDPEAVLAEHELTVAEKELLRSADRYRLMQSVQGDLAAEPGF